MEELDLGKLNAARVGIISDTHGLLREEAVDTLRTCRCILHGGDIGDERTLRALQGIAPTYAVRGNNDQGEWADELQPYLFILVAGLRFYMIHNRKELPSDLTREQTDVILFGHSHKYFCEEKNGILWLNPGSCGRRRFSLPLTMAVLEIRDSRYEVQQIEIPYGQG